AEFPQECSRPLLFSRRQPGDGPRDSSRVPVEGRLDQRLPRRRQFHVADAAVFLTICAPHKPASREAIHEISRPTARDENLLLELTRPQAPLVQQRLQYSELSESKAILFGVSLRVARHCRMRPCEHYPQLQRVLALRGGEFSQSKLRFSR